MNVIITSLSGKGLGFRIIQAKMLKIVLSINDDTAVETLFLNQSNLFELTVFK